MGCVCRPNESLLRLPVSLRGRTGFDLQCLSLLARIPSVCTRSSSPQPSWRSDGHRTDVARLWSNCPVHPITHSHQPLLHGARAGGEALLHSSDSCRRGGCSCRGWFHGGV